MADSPVWHLLGAGSLGTLVAARLLDAGFTVRACTRNGATTTLHRTLHFPDGTTRELALPASSADEPIHHLVLAVKARDTSDALTPLLPRFAPGATLLTVQNGLGALDDVRLPRDLNVIHAVTTDGAWRDGSRITVAAINETQAGDGGERVPDWFPTLMRHWQGLYWTRDIVRAQWRKLAVNAVINPLTALHDCPNGALVEDDVLRREMAALAAEVDRVAGHVLADWPNDTFVRSVRVARQTARNMSSMRADVRAGRRTEIDFINGYLVREGKRFGIRLPVNERVVAAVESRDPADRG